MPFIDSQGVVREKRSPWRLSIFSDFFWGIMAFLSLFVNPLTKPTGAKKTNHSGFQAKKPGWGGGGGGGGGGKPPGGGGGGGGGSSGPNRRIGRIGRDGPGNVPMPAAGG